jgi:hypothetical protein
MGNCKSAANNSTSKSSKKYSKSSGKDKGTELISKPVPTKYTLSQANLVYEAVLNAYIRKKSIPECGAVFMMRGGKAHISLTLLPGELAEMSAFECVAITKLLEDYFISIGVNHEIYINPTVDNPNIYKLYCHLTTFG